MLLRRALLAALNVLLISVIVTRQAQAKVDYDPKKTKCHHCRTFTKKFQKFMAMSKGKNFGGGDTEWEEKRGQKYDTSETRLMEILENICGSDFGCANILEEYEEEIEDWFFNTKNKDKNKDTDKLKIYENPFFQHLCVDKLKFCCPNDKTYGPKCSLCPGYEKDSDEWSKVCSGHGTCEGAGDRKGTGKCSCDSSYKGKKCDQCKANFFKAENGDCRKCHKSCKSGCSGSTNIDCSGKDNDKLCAKGYEVEVDGDIRRCVDINECLSEDVHGCHKKDKNGRKFYCKNREGSFTCEPCHIGCVSCDGPGSTRCLECKEGYKKILIDEEGQDLADSEIDSGDDSKFRCLKIEEPKPEVEVEESAEEKERTDEKKDEGSETETATQEQAETADGSRDEL